MKHALITGAGGGIGSAIAHTLAGHGYRVSLLGRRTEALETTASAIGKSDLCACITCDVTSDIGVAEAFERADARFGAVEILVNCAGAAPSAPFHKLSAAHWQQVIDVNLNGVFRCCARAIGPMRERGAGRIVNIASTASLKGYACVSAYCAAKHGVLGLTRALALETASKGITVNAVCPGYTDTNIIRDAVADSVAKTGLSHREVLHRFTSTNPQGRLIEPQEVADTVSWLCSDGARSITGQAISVSGGEI